MISIIKYEDYTTFTELDPNNEITIINSRHVSATLQSAVAYLYKDEGVDFFDDFIHFLDLKCDFDEGEGPNGYPWLLSNNLGDYTTLSNAHDSLLGIETYRSGGSYYMGLFEEYGGVWQGDWASVSASTWYYLRITKSGTSFECKFYTISSDRDNDTGNNLLATLVITLSSTTKYRYIFGCNSIFATHYMANLSVTLITPPTPPATGETLVLTNPNGTLWCKPIKWRETQQCAPAIRPLPLASSEYLDASTYVLKPRTIEFVVRLSDSEKKTFESIYNYASVTGTNQYTDIYLYYDDSSYIWYYSAWISDKSYKWEYSMESGRYVRWWYVTITCNVKDFLGSDTILPSYSLSTVTIDSHTLDFILDFERTDKHPPMLPQWVNQAEVVDSYLWNECVLDVSYTYRATNAEKFVMDTTLRNHIEVIYEDYIHNLFSKSNYGAWVSSIEAQWDDTNWEKPWKITVSIQANNNEIESKTASIDLALSAYYGKIYVDGVDMGSLPATVILDYGIHEFQYIPTSGIGIMTDSTITTLVIGDGTVTSGSPNWYDWIVSANIDILDSFYKGGGPAVITNGGFETGDFTGWVPYGHDDSCSHQYNIDPPYIVTTPVYEGVYAAAMPPLSSCIQPITAYFDKSQISICAVLARCASGSGDIEVTVWYTDLTSTVWTETVTGYTTIDIRSHLVVGKDVSSIGFATYNKFMYIDYLHLS